MDFVPYQLADRRLSFGCSTLSMIALQVVDFSFLGDRAAYKLEQLGRTQGT